jgi:hypothetical protein
MDLGRILGEAHEGENIGFGLIHQGGKLGDLGPELIGLLTPLGAGHFDILRAKAVAMKAATTRRPCLPAWAKTLR